MEYWFTNERKGKDSSPGLLVDENKYKKQKTGKKNKNKW